MHNDINTRGFAVGHHGGGVRTIEHEAMKAHAYEPTKRAATPMSHQPSAHYFEEPALTWEKATELMQQAQALREYVAEGKIEHFAAEHYSHKTYRRIVATLDKGTAMRIITEAEKMEEQAADMRAYLEWLAPKRYPCSAHADEPGEVQRS